MCRTRGDGGPLVQGGRRGRRASALGTRGQASSKVCGVVMSAETARTIPSGRSTSAGQSAPKRLHPSVPPSCGARIAAFRARMGGPRLEIIKVSEPRYHRSTSLTRSLESTSCSRSASCTTLAIPTSTTKKSVRYAQSALSHGRTLTLRTVELLAARRGPAQDTPRTE